MFKHIFSGGKHVSGYSFHGTIAIDITKPLYTQRDLALSYSPGVAAPCRAIYEDPLSVYRYTSKGNFAGIISNGTDVRGMGNIGALAAKPWLEQSVIILKQFAGIDAIDIGISDEDPEILLRCVQFLSQSWGAVHLQDIRFPEGIMLGERLQKMLSIPVYNETKYGRPVVALAALINAAIKTGRQLTDMRLVIAGSQTVEGEGFAGLLKAAGVPQSHITLCSLTSPGEGETAEEALAEALAGSDVLVNFSLNMLLTGEMVMSMAKNPVIFLLADPRLDIKAVRLRTLRPDAIIATGGAYSKNFISSILASPYIMRAALDVKAKAISMKMQLAAAESLAVLGREPLPEHFYPSPFRNYLSRSFATVFAPKAKLLPSPFDPRLILRLPAAIAKAAMDEHIAMHKIQDMEVYRKELQCKIKA